MAAKIVILGGGESGAGASILAKKKGFDVFLSDAGKIQDKYKNALINHDINWEEGKHSLEKILEADEVIKSPGIPDKVAVIEAIKNKGIPIISEIEFAGRYTNAKKICITGSNGKTTTTLLTYHVLKSAGYNVGIAGNVGKSFAWQVAENDYDYFVLEISSFQLDGMYNFKADVAVLLNITPDHLDRYDYSFEKYVESKMRILRNQTNDDFFIYNHDDAAIQSWLSKNDIASKKYPFSTTQEFAEGAFLIDKREININVNKVALNIDIMEMTIQGIHNAKNSMASGIAARLVDVRKEFIKQSFCDFQNIEHRLEPVGFVKGIEFINDSKATNVNSAWYALESMTKPVIWIVGGQEKSNDYAELIPLVIAKVKAIVCLGKDNKNIINVFKNHVLKIIETNTAKDAVNAAYNLGEPGDVVLLSPACASFDLFENFEERGQKFKQAVFDL
jgi:UDP-N-acetylmuramoylalanine--D-glutamate ligase